MSLSREDAVLSSDLGGTGIRKLIRSTTTIETEEQINVSLRDGHVILSSGKGSFGFRLKLSAQEAQHLAGLLASAASRVGSEGNV